MKGWYDPVGVEEKIVILGAGGLGREALEVVKQYNQQQVYASFKKGIIGFVDEDAQKIETEINRCPVYDFDWLSKAKDIKAVCAIGNTEARRKVTLRAEKLGVEFTNVIHPNAQISDFATFGKGVIVCAGNIIAPNTQIGNHVYINMNCIVGHDAVLDDYVFLGPGVCVDGLCQVKEGAFIGTNASLIPGVTIGKWSVVGAGAVVLKDIPAYSVAVGVPAAVISSKKEILRGLTTPAKIPDEATEWAKEWREELTAG